MSRKEASKARRQFIKKRRGLLNKEVDSLQEQLLSVILDQFWSKFETSNGQIISNGKNITLGTALDKIYDEFNQTKGIKVVETFAKDLLTINSLNAQYFTVFGTSESLFETVRNRVLRLTKKNLGLDSKNGLSKNGFLEKFISDEQLRAEIKNLTFQAISSGQSHQQFKRSLKDVIVGNDSYKGGLQRHYRTFAYDTYQEVDRSNQIMFANELGLKAFVYAGTVISGTRKFCKTKVGKVFTIEEAEKWTNQRWQGKNRDYNPLTDMGGHNCLHQADFISNEEAARRRKDLVVDENGNLTKK